VNTIERGKERERNRNFLMSGEGDQGGICTGGGTSWRAKLKIVKKAWISISPRGLTPSLCFRKTFKEI